MISRFLVFTATLLMINGASAKNIAVFMDGTGNSECFRLGENSDTTNVFRIFEMAEKNADQVAFYRRGIGSFDIGTKVGAKSVPYAGKSCELINPSRESDIEITGKLNRFNTGAGTEANVAYAEKFVRENYQKGDSVYIIGFSRGAAAAHLLSQALSHGKDGMGHVPVRFLGLFDMVYAFKLDILRIAAGRRSSHAFVFIPNTVEQVVHLIAADETRKYFQASRINRLQAGLIRREMSKERSSQLKEVWFAGSHADIGGGYKKRQLAEISLRYMLEKAKAAGLKIKAKEVATGLAKEYYQSMLSVNGDSIVAGDLVDKVHLSPLETDRPLIMRKGRSGNTRRKFKTDSHAFFHPSVQAIYKMNSGHLYCDPHTKSKTAGNQCRDEFPQNVRSLLDQKMGPHSSVTTHGCVKAEGFSAKLSPSLCN